ncbi:MAG: hypothetical protein EXS19_05995 [Pedosphaera sp.]|nr:hypothetical protein [Pedosphaera sp.]
MKSLFVALLAFTLSVHARQFTFRDGTVIEAYIHGASPFAPAADGLTLHMRGMIYFHHYPATTESYAPPTRASASNPNNLPSCVPSRIAFMHFSRETLLALRRDYAHVAGLSAAPVPVQDSSQGYAILHGQPVAPPPVQFVYPEETRMAARDIITGIDRALENQARFRPEATAAATQQWQSLVEWEMRTYFGSQAVWGKQLQRPPTGR